MAGANKFIITGVKETISALQRFARDDTPFITAYALTKTGQDVKAAEIDQMRRSFDRPTPYVLNALQLKPATKTDPIAIVGYKGASSSGTPAEKFLAPQVEGGPRKHKSHELRLIRAGLMKSGEYAVPTKLAPLDAFGNMKGSTLERILSDVQAAEQWAGYDANSTAKTRKRKAKAGKGTYFALRDRGVAPGIYFRLGLRDIRPIILFVKQPKYTKRFPFHEVGAKVFADRFVVHARAGFERAMKSRR